MDRITFFLLVFIMSSTVIMTGCDKDDETGLKGTYSRTQQFGNQSYRVELQFTNDGLLIWTPVDAIPGHTASTVSYEVMADERFRIYDDPDCGNEGTYTYASDKNGLEVTKVSDACDPRAEAMSGYWARK